MAKYFELVCRKLAQNGSVCQLLRLELQKNCEILAHFLRFLHLWYLISNEVLKNEAKLEFI